MKQQNKTQQQGLPWWSSGKESALQGRDTCSTPGQGTKPVHHNY